MNVLATWLSSLMVWVCSAAETQALTKTAVSHCVAISGRHKASYTRLYNVYIGCCLLCLLVECTHGATRGHSSVCYSHLSSVLDSLLFL